MLEIKRRFRICSEQIQLCLTNKPEIFLCANFLFVNLITVT